MIWLALVALLQMIPEAPDNFIVTPSPNTVFVVGSSITVQPKTGAARAAQIVNAGLVTSCLSPDPLGIDDGFDWPKWEES